jgi:hypothetical protein
MESSSARSAFRGIDQHRGRFDVESICRTLGVSASALGLGLSQAD